ncbi:MAG: copper chaperone PCu(A)C [Proteobacteria bacterium]|nr:MAG: copper chaperone PCu(A)C [Pseudomonadota bacterium]
MKNMLLISLIILVYSVSSPVSAKLSALEKSLILENGIIYRPLAGSSATAGYGTIINPTDEEVQIVGIEAEGFKASEIHTTIEENGLMKMRRIELIPISAKGRFELKPGGNHIMLFDSLRAFKSGDKVQVTFKTKKSKTALPFIITERPTAEPVSHSHH